MPLRAFSATNFRCLASIRFEPAENFNLIYGANASGKTSILEAIAYLGRGRSFRGTGPSELVRHGESEFVVFGEADDPSRTRRIGVRNGKGALEVKVDGAAGGLADLAEALPLQVVDPNVHDLIAGAPDERRRFLDWIAFHVEHGFLDAWRRQKRALRQRNAALRAGAAPEALAGWTMEFVGAAEVVDRGRRAALAAIADELASTVAELLGTTITVSYEQGWSADRSLEEALAAGLARDGQTGSTQHGPHRADLKLETGGSKARNVVSRGQQKLLACALILAATATVQRQIDRRMVLLLDDPAAELDAGALERLMARVARLEAQIIATTLERGSLDPGTSAAVFHVEHGELSPTN